MIIVFTGDGKGKTTAAIGQGLRALGHGRRVICFQFIKSKRFPSGEEESVKQFGSRFRLIKGGLGFVGILGDRLPRSAHRAAARRTFERARQAALSGRYHLVIFDEVNVAVSLGLLLERTVARFLRAVPEKVDVILTGRGAPQAFFDHAHLVTVFRAEKHPFAGGAAARRGVEF